MESSKYGINILVTLNEAYLPHLNVMLFTLIRYNPDCYFDVYLLHSAIREESLHPTEAVLGQTGCLHPIRISESGLENAPTTSRYPQEIYFRIFASYYLPKNLERVLYLDPDLVVNGSILPLYRIPLDEYYFAAASHIGTFMHKVNELRLDMDEDSPYINSGVMLMNLELLRLEQNFDDVFAFIEKRKSHLVLPDQDIISSLYGCKIYTLDPFRYNMTERLYQKQIFFERDFNLEWVKKHSVIIHYCGRNKPWKENYIGQLSVFYQQAIEQMETQTSKEFAGFGQIPQPFLPKDAKLHKTRKEHPHE